MGSLISGIVEAIMIVLKGLFGTSKPQETAVEHPEPEVKVDGGRTDKEKLKDLGLFCLALLFLLSGCGLTLGPVVEKRAIIVKSGLPIEVLDSVVVHGHLVKDSKGEDIFSQDIGGWVAMHPDHWEAVKNEMTRLRKKAGEQDGEGEGK